MSTNGIDFVIGGKDNASAAMGSAEKSMARLSGAEYRAMQASRKNRVAARSADELWRSTIEETAGKGSVSYKRLSDAAAKLATTTRASLAKVKASVDAKPLAALDTGAKALTTTMNHLTIAMGPIIAILAAVKVAMTAVGGIKAANEAFDAQADSVKKLNSALAIRGQKSASTGMQAVAKDLEKLTGVSDQSTLALMQQAQSMGFATDRMDDAAKAALGLAEATGKTADQSLGDLKAALEGNFDAFVGLNPQIMYMRTNQEKLAAVLAIADQGLTAQSQNMNTVAGSGQRANTAIETLMESVGAIIAPIRVLISAGLQQLSESLTSVLAPAVQWATQLLENIGPIMDWVREKVVAGVNVIIGAFTWLEVVVTNLGSVWELAKAYAESAMLGIAGAIMHTLTEVIPEYAKWFGQNFINLIKDAFNGVIAVITNAGIIIGDMVYEIFAFIASGGEGGVSGLMSNLGKAASRSLVEGFDSSLTSLPEIAARQLTQREKDLADKIGAIGGRLGKEFSDKMAERMVGVGSTLGDELNSAAKGIDLKGRPNVITQGVQVTEGRLLSRGPGSYLTNKLDQVIQLLKNPPAPKKNNKILVQIDPQQMQTWDDIRENTSNTMQMESIA